MITRAIREYVDRDWRAVRKAKDTYWADRIARLGPVEGVRIADHLRHQAILRDPDWPGAGERREDFNAHSRVSDAMRRAYPTRRR